jgi:hypothetical protein
MTKDHKQPKSKGGADHIDNMQTLCCTCNELKGNKKGTLKRLREIQDGVQTVYTVSSPSGYAVDYFATSKKGLMELVDQIIKSEYWWEEGSYKISVSLRLGEIYVEHSSESLTFYINTFGRV